MTSEIVQVNRAPVLTLWAGVVARRLGYDEEAALSLGRALAGLNAQAKGRRLGIFKPAEAGKAPPSKKPRLGEEFWVELLGRPVPVVQTDRGLRAISGARPVEPESVERYLEGKFGEALESVRRAMAALANSLEPAELAAKAYTFYEHFRPSVPEGVTGWGAKGELSLDRIRELAEED
jgi:hypothetical protein